MKKSCLICGLVLSFFSLGYFCGQRITKNRIAGKIIARDSIIWMHDTLPPETNLQPVLRIEDFEHLIQLPETKFITDTVTKLVFLPREELTYEGGTDTSGRWKAVISGVLPELVSMQQFPATKIHEITSVVYAPEKKYSHWSIGVSAGYGWNGKSLGPTLGVSINYSLIRFRKK